MGVERKVLAPGNGLDKPKKGDLVTIEYTGNLHDPSAPESRGTQYVTIIMTLRGDEFMADIACRQV